MGKKNKNKQKISGSVKTAIKTEKKLNAKHKKELAALGEDDIEKVVAQIEREEAQRQKVVEVVVNQPSRRVNFTLTPHPFKDELIMLGGEFYDGKITTVYGDMFFYNINKKIWTLIKAPGAPPPRCGHQTVAIPNNKGELWVFGGEYSSPSESQFYHYKDLWVYHIGGKKWEKVVAPGGPSSRSGHRMIYNKKQLFIFGGFNDNIRDFKYYNDLHIFDLSNYKWTKIDLIGNIPPPRSGCITLSMPDNKILVYGGYSKEKVKKDVDRGEIHSDMFVLMPDKHDEKNLKWKSIQVKQCGLKFLPRCSSSAILIQPNMAYLFGGVNDNEEDDDEIHGTFFNDLFALDMEKYQWRTVNLVGDKDKSQRRKKKEGGKEVDKEELVNEDEDHDENLQMAVDETTTPTVTTMDDGIFTVTVGPAPVTSVNSNSVDNIKVNIFSPSPRINPGLAVKNNILYLYGGMYEDGDRTYTFNDFYKLDLHKLNEWETIIADDVSKQIWLESESSESDDSSTDNDDSSDEEMDIDEK